MLLFFAFFLKVIPLYLNLLLGFLAGKFLNASRDTVAKLMFFMINPIVIFNGVINTKINNSILFLPLVTFVIGSSLCFLFYRLSGRLWQDSVRNLVAFSSGTGNTGYFGLPLALLLFSDQGEGVYIMAILGLTLYENSLGYYMIARGTHSAAECCIKLVKLPSLYAFIGGLAFNLLKIPIPEVFIEFMKHIKGTYTVLGMMIIGLGLAGLTQFKLDVKFIGLTFLAKFIAWPAAIILIVFADIYLFGFFSPDIYRALMLIAIVPLAANTVILASLLQIHPEKAATAVLLSTLLALIYVPIMARYFII